MTADYLDTQVYVLFDEIPSLCCCPYSENIHGFDERVGITSLNRGAIAMALFSGWWGGGAG